MIPQDSFGDWLMTVQLIDIVVLLVCGIVAKKKGSLDPTNGDFPDRWVWGFVLAWIGWFVFVLVDLVYHVVTGDWLSVAIDVLILLWVWWDFFGGSGKWKKWKKRAKERVAVIKGRLKVVPVAPVPA